MFVSLRAPENIDIYQTILEEPMVHSLGGFNGSCVCFSAFHIILELSISVPHSLKLNNCNVGRSMQILGSDCYFSEVFVK